MIGDDFANTPGNIVGKRILREEHRAPEAAIHADYPFRGPVALGNLLVEIVLIKDVRDGAVSGRQTSPDARIGDHHCDDDEQRHMHPRGDSDDRRVMLLRFWKRICHVYTPGLTHIYVQEDS